MSTAAARSRSTDPGQLVGYPITKLPSHVLVVDYVRRVEEALIRAVADLGVATGRVAGRSGVWLPAGNGKIERKVAAIGIRVSRGVTMHGFSLNADVDLELLRPLRPVRHRRRRSDLPEQPSWAVTSRFRRPPQPSLRTSSSCCSGSRT